MKQITAIIIGAGSRGNVYASYAEKFPQELKIVAVADPDTDRRNAMAVRYGIPDENCFSGWETLLNRPKMADIALICTQDSMHVEPAIQAMKQGYDMLLEKPLAPDRAGCELLLEEYKKHNISVAVAHVLRYTPFFMTIKSLLDRDEIGRIQGIQHNENVGHIHYSHSYVRGNWRNRDKSSPMILAKSCHDMDILLFLTGSDCLQLNSYGTRGIFTADNRPVNAPERCLDGCPHRRDCPYYAPKIYQTGSTSWPVDVLTSDLSPEGVNNALLSGPYGRCVYACDNDVIEHQTVNLQFKNGIPVVFTMSAFTGETSRTIKIMGEKGELRGHMERQEIEVYDFATHRTHKINLDSSSEGHGGGDLGIMRDFLFHLNDKSKPLPSCLDDALQSHLMAFAVDKSRLDGNPVRMDEF